MIIIRGHKGTWAQSYVTLCGGWQTECVAGNKISKTSVLQKAEKTSAPSSAQGPADTLDGQPFDIATEVHVAAVYDGRWYIGRVLIVDENDSEVEITFMESKKRLLQWPVKPDVRWVPRRNIVCIVEKLQSCAKTARMFKLSESYYEHVASSFNMYVNM